MITLRDTETGRTVGTITEEQLRALRDHLEEESPDDTDYWIDEPTLEAMAEEGVDAALVALLRAAVGDREGVEIRWERG
jgi:processive 1,2-diacylglycerol beta-glucosyltransferase